jgi:CheY-like chemotaxis protein
MTRNRNLEGRRILVLEDEPLVAMLIADFLTELGCSPVGPSACVSTGCELAERNGLDGAILDVNLRGETSYPVAEMLEARSIPFCFATGYGIVELSERWRDQAILPKPFTIDDLRKTLVRMMPAEMAESLAS